MDLEKLEELPLDIVRLQKKIEKGKKENKICNLKCNMKKISAISRFSAAVLAIPIAGSIITTVNGWNPFKLNSVERHPVITTHIDNDGNVEQIDDKGEYNIESYLYYYTNWVQTNEGNYKRKKFTYKIDKDDMNKVLSLKGQELSNEKLEELLNIASYNISVDEEFIGSINEEDNIGYIEAVIRKEDESKIIITKETKDEHSEKFLEYLVLEILLMILEFSYLCLLTDYIDKIKEDLKCKPKKVDIEKLEEELAAKRLLFEETLFLTSHTKFDNELSNQKIKNMKKSV